MILTVSNPKRERIYKTINNKDFEGRMWRWGQWSCNERKNVKEGGKERELKELEYEMGVSSDMTTCVPKFKQ